MNRHGRFSLTMLLLLAAAGCGLQPGGTFHSKSFQGQRPPELTAPSGRWINAEAGLSLEALQGQVVWLEFSFLH